MLLSLFETMKTILSLLLVVAFIAATECRAGDTPPAPAQHARTYDFAYLVQPENKSFLVQVFDDGKRTYLQFTRPEPVPAIFVVTSAGQILLTPKREGQFFVIERVEQQLLITLGAIRVSVRYVGKDRREYPPALFGATKPVQITGSAPTPVSAEQIRASRATAPDAQPVASAGVARAPEAEAPAVPVPANPPIPSWLVRTEDRTISVTLARWALAAGYAFSWDAPRDFPTTIPAVFNEPFEKAVLDVVMSYSNSDAPIKAEFTRFGPNKVLRIVKYQGNSHE